MNRIPTVLLSASAVVAAAATAVTVPSSAPAPRRPASPGPRCPTLHTRPTTPATLRMTLHRSGCHGVGFDNGPSPTCAARAAASRSTSVVELRRHADRDFYANVDAAGTYRLAGGRVELYDSQRRAHPGPWTDTPSGRLTITRPTSATPPGPGRAGAGAAATRVVPRRRAGPARPARPRRRSAATSAVSAASPPGRVAAHDPQRRARSVAHSQRDVPVLLRRAASRACCAASAAPG